MFKPISHHTRVKSALLATLFATILFGASTAAVAARPYIEDWSTPGDLRGWTSSTYGTMTAQSGKLQWTHTLGGSYLIYATKTASGGSFVGDYTAAGITRIEFDHRVMSGSPEAPYLVISDGKTTYFNQSLTAPPGLDAETHYSVALDTNAGWWRYNGLAPFEEVLTAVSSIAIGVSGGGSGTLDNVELSLDPWVLSLEIPLSVPRFDRLTTSVPVDGAAAVEIDLALGYDDRGKVVSAGECNVDGVDVEVTGAVKSKKGRARYGLSLKGDEPRIRGKIKGVLEDGPALASIKIRGPDRRISRKDHLVSLTAPPFDTRLILDLTEDARLSLHGTAKLVDGPGDAGPRVGTLVGRRRRQTLSFSVKIGNAKIAFRGRQFVSFVPGAPFPVGFVGTLKCKIPPESARLPDSWFPDPSGVVTFQSDRDGSPGVYVTNGRATAAPVFLAEGREPCLSRDGRVLAFTDHQNIFTIDTKGAGLVNVTGHPPDAVGAYVSAPALSPEGERIAFVRKAVVPNPLASLRLINADGAGERELARDADEPAFSPDGSTIVFVRQNGLFTIRSDGSGLRTLIESGVGVTRRHPSFSPDGERVVYSSTVVVPGALVAVEMLDLRSGDRTMIVTDGSEPSFAPTGNAVIFVRDGAILRTAVDDADDGAIALTSGPSDSSPDWAASF